MNQFAHNLLSLDVAEQLTSLISEAEERTREKIPAVEQGWEGKYCQLYQRLKLYMYSYHRFMIQTNQSAI